MDLALWRQETDGSLVLANSYTYGTWGSPSTATHNGIGDLGFRFLYVGAADVQWDDFSGAGLLYMHARHYHPLIGRCLQPDPSAAEANLYGYAGNSPVSRVDPKGTYNANVWEKRYCNSGHWFACIESAEWARAETRRLTGGNVDGTWTKRQMKACTVGSARTVFLLTAAIATIAAAGLVMTAATGRYPLQQFRLAGRTMEIVTLDAHALDAPLPRLEFASGVGKVTVTDACARVILEFDLDSDGDSIGFRQIEHDSGLLPSADDCAATRITEIAVALEGVDRWSVSDGDRVQFEGTHTLELRASP